MPLSLPRPTLAPPALPRLALAAALALSAACPAAAATLFDGTGLTSSSILRTGAPRGLAANFRLPGAIHLTGFSQMIDLTEDSQVRFVIYEKVYDVTTGPALFWASDAVAVADAGTGPQEIASPLLDLVLPQGTGWAMGVIVDRDARYYYGTTIPGVTEQNGISTADNTNIHGFDFLTPASFGTVEGAVSLFGEIAAVPAPAAAPLALSGLAALGLLGRRRRA